MRKLSAIFGFSLLCAVSAFAGQDAKERIRLLHITPRHALETMAHNAITDSKVKRSFLPVGITSLEQSDKDNSLLASGSAAAVAQLKELIRMIDVPITEIKIEGRILKVTFDKDGTWDMDIVSQPVMVTTNNIDTSVSITGAGNGYSVKINPTLFPNGTMLLTGEFALFNDGAAYTSSFGRRVAPNKRITIAGVTDVLAVGLREAIRSGKIPSSERPYTAYYLQLTPTISQR
jgi:hypothetical protein